MAKFSSQDITSYAAVVVAIVALYVGWDQSRIIRNQQHADVYPVVQMKSQFLMQTMEDGNDYRTLSFELFNAGVGPAFIESASWSIAGTSIAHVGDIQGLLPKGLVPAGQYQGQFSNIVLAPGASAEVWNIAFPTDTESEVLTQRFMQDFWAMDMQVCYCSLYEKCWKSEYNAESPRPSAVEAC